MPDVLKIGAEFDVGPIIAGSQAAVAATDNLSNAIQQQAARMEAQGFSAKDTADALVALGYSSKEVTAALATQAEVTETVAAANVNMRSSMGMARVEMGAMTGSTGAMEYGLARLAAQSSALAPLLMELFPAFLAVAFVDILSSMYDKIVDMTSAWGGWDKAAQAAYEDALKANQKHMDFLTQIKIQQLDVATVGTTGTAKNRIEQENLNKEIQIYSDRMREIFGLQQEFQKQRDVGKTSVIPAELTEGGQAVTVVTKPTVGSKEWDELTKKISAAQDELDKYAEKIKEIQAIKIPKVEAEAPKAAADEAQKRADEQYRDFESLNAMQELAARGAAEEQRQSDEATKKAIENSWKQYEAAQASQEEITREVAKEIKNQEKLQTEQVKAAEKSGLEQVSAQKAAIDATAELEKAKVAGSQSPEIMKLEALKIIDAQKIAELEKNAAEKYAVELKSAQDQKAIDLGGMTEPEVQAKARGTGDTGQAEKVAADNQKILDAEAAFAAQMAAYKAKEALDAQQSADKIQQAYLKAFAPANSAFQTFTDHIIQGNETVRIAFERMCNSILMSWAKMLEQKILLSVEAAAQEKIIAAAEALYQIIKSAAVAAAGAFASQAAIPIVGPVLGDAAASDSLATVMGYAGMASAQQGAILPRDMPLVGHEGEMMLPKPISSGIQSVIPAMQKFGSAMDESGARGASPAASAAASGGDTHLHMNFNTFDQKGLADFLHQPGNRAAFTKAVRTAARNGMRFR